jgi:hypothetical protein
MIFQIEFNKPVVNDFDFKAAVFLITNFIEDADITIHHIQFISMNETEHDIVKEFQMIYPNNIELDKEL